MIGFYRIGESVEFETKLFTCDDKDFHQLHDWIVRRVTTKYNPLVILSNGSTNGSSGLSGNGNGSIGSGSNRGCLSVVLKLFVGDAAHLRRENQFLFKTFPQVKKIGFPNVIMPGDVRCVYNIDVWNLANISICA